ncbi:hypothetical protein BSYN_27080 [Bacteroides sedimenti]|uniref:Uncharacterized protein n=2 Tax=Bacteroides sedimenti TaxID=2136147 RepID=A0ABM8IK59_9BACE
MGCGPADKDIYTLSEIKKICSPTDPIFDPRPDFNLVFTIGVDDSIYVLNINQLHKLYKRGYVNKYKKFYDFAYEALNQRIKVDFKKSTIVYDYKRRFKLMPYITILYNQEGLEGLIDRFCKYDEKRGFYFLQLKTDIHMYASTISYYFFLNRYYTLESDDQFGVSYTNIDKW